MPTIGEVMTGVTLRVPPALAVTCIRRSSCARLRLKVGMKYCPMHSVKYVWEVFVPGMYASRPFAVSPASSLHISTSRLKSDCETSLIESISSAVPLSVWMSIPASVPGTFWGNRVTTCCVVAVYVNDVLFPTVVVVCIDGL